MVELEDKFLDLVFEMGDLQGLTKKDMYAYNRFIAARRLFQLGLKTNFEEQNLIVGGGLDDVWHNPKTNEIHIVDYKSTAQGKNEEGNALKEINLYGTYKEGYKRRSI